MTLHLMSDRSFADRRCIRVRTVPAGMGTEDGTVTAFNGPTAGCGPIFMTFGKSEVRVDSPERFGDTFGQAWVSAFYGVGYAS